MDRSAIPRDAVELNDMVAAINEETRGLLDLDPLIRGTRGHTSLAELWEAVAAEARREAGADPTTPRLALLLDVLDRIRCAESAHARQQLANQTRQLAQVHTALAELTGATTVDALLTRIPEAACGLGFDRALVSTVDGVWRLHTMHVVRDPRWAADIVAVGQQNPPVLDRNLVENDTVAGARAVLVQDVQDNPRVNRPLAAVTRSTSYGIAPLIIDGDVVGLIHGDCYHQARALTDLDRMLLSIFAQGSSQYLARVSMLESISAVRAQLDGAGLWRSRTPRVAGSVAVSRDDNTVLTRREVQIVRLLAAGDSNAKIARRLTISEGTVKSHITHVLRKLGAANRAEAVSIWLRGADTAGAIRA